MQHRIGEGDQVNYDDGFDQLQAEVVSLNNETAIVRFTKGNCRHPRRTKEEVCLQYLFPIDTEEIIADYLE